MNLVATFDETIVAGTGNITVRNLTEAVDIVIPVDDPRVSIAGALLTIAVLLRISANKMGMESTTILLTLAAHSTFTRCALGRTWTSTFGIDPARRCALSGAPTRLS